MGPFLLEDFERAPFGEMTVTAAGNRRSQHRAPIVEEIRPLLLQIDLD